MPRELNYNESQLLQWMRIMYTEAEFSDGSVTIPTSIFEAFERVFHGIYEMYQPSYLDSQASVCRWNCNYCKENDASK